MAMATPQGTPYLVGPVPFEDVGGGGGEDHIVAVPPPEDEYADIVSAMPSTTMIGFPLLRYQGSWLLKTWVTGVLSVQRRFAPRPDDVLLASLPKCGTTWLKSLAFSTMARAAYPPSAADHPLLRLNPHQCVPFLDDLFSSGEATKAVEALPSPRLMNTHMHHSLLPPSVTAGKCKIVYVCRDPKDGLVSMWYFAKSIMPAGSTYTFSDMFEHACHGETPNGPIWDNILSYWRASRAHPDKVLFLRYEEMLLDPGHAVTNLARFLGVPFTAAEEAEGTSADIVELCSFKAMKVLPANNTGTFTMLGFPHRSLFRKGVAGDWVDHMTPEMARRFDGIVHEKLRGSGLTFAAP
uniref:Uncharacterized protein n=1 Tax=Avena sativa TaxID=4498 RepID=A0ACD5XRJ2_AVESA